MESGVNKELEIISSNEEIASIEWKNQVSGMIHLWKTGTVEITVYPKYNPDAKQIFNINILI